VTQNNKLRHKNVFNVGAGLGPTQVSGLQAAAVSPPLRSFEKDSKSQAFSPGVSLISLLFFVNDGGPK